MMARHHSPRFLALVEDAKKRTRDISVAELKKRLATDGFHLVDVREAEEWIAGHIPGAQHLCKGIIERDAESKFPDPNAEIILCCRGGFRSALAADNLQKMGYTRVVSVAGGWRSWTEAGFPAEK